MLLSQLADALGISGYYAVSFDSVAIDSRQVRPGALFVAIRGERMDGHDFVKDAVSRGAVAVLCSHPVPSCEVLQLCVPDTIQALGLLATLHRRTLTAPIVSVTGSNGKTTVKEMIAAILPNPSFATPGNLNNHLGVPLSILQMTSEYRYAVFELGASHIGEIAYTVGIVQPHVALITNIAPAHIQGFGSIAGVVQAKGEIYQGLPSGGTAVINADSPYAHAWDAFLHDKKTTYFSIAGPADVYARDLMIGVDGCANFVLVTGSGEAPITLRVPGLHTVSNALAAAACTHALGISMSDIVRGLSVFSGVPGRMTFLSGKNQTLIIDDTYNANLQSTKAALEVLSRREGLRIFVFGDMAELGDTALQHHRDVGLFAREMQIEMVMTCGKLSHSTADAFGDTGQHYDNQQTLMEDLLHHLDASTTILVKGSRSVAMEHIVHQLMES